MASGTLVKIDPTGGVTRFRCEGRAGPTVEEIQKALGGYFAHLYCLYGGQERSCYVDEDGDPKQLPTNPFGDRLVKEYYMGGNRVVQLNSIGTLRGNLVVWVPDPPESQAETGRLATRDFSRRDLGG